MIPALPAPLQPPEIMVDIEALGKRPGAAIIEIGAVAFQPSTGATLAEFHRLIAPHPLALADLETLAWHTRQGTWPRPFPPGDPLPAVLADFSTWARALGARTFWAWGASYDFPLLDAAFAAEHLAAPYHYTRCNCARTVWNITYPGTRATPKPHHALEDARISVIDLQQALRRPEACFNQS